MASSGCHPSRNSKRTTRIKLIPGLWVKRLGIWLGDRAPDIFSQRFSAKQPVIQAQDAKEAFQQIPWCEKRRMANRNSSFCGATRFALVLRRPQRLSIVTFSSQMLLSSSLFLLGSQHF